MGLTARSTSICSRPVLSRCIAKRVFVRGGEGLTFNRLDVSVSGRMWQLGYSKEIEHFVNCVRGDEDPFPDGEFGKKVLEVVSVAYKSVEEGKPQTF